MLLFMDSEFTGLRKDTTLISLGIVAEDGRKFYAEFCDYNRKQCDNWILENVISNLYLPKHLYKGTDISMPRKIGAIFNAEEIDKTMNVFGDREWVTKYLKEWISQFDSVQFVSDVCHYDFVLLIDLFGTAFDLPKNVCAACHDINQDIARHYGISEREAFDKSREEIVMELFGHEVEGRKHNALYDAEVIKSIYEEIGK